MRSSFGHHALSPQLLFMLGLVHPEPSGDEELVCVRVHACMHVRRSSCEGFW